VRHLRSVSIVMFVLGAAIVVATRLLPLSPTWTLTGLLLTWAGIVKLIVVYLWHGIAGRGSATSVSGDNH
jgi:hypothetical protein